MLQIIFAPIQLVELVMMIYGLSLLLLQQPIQKLLLQKEQQQGKQQGKQQEEKHEEQEEEKQEEQEEEKQLTEALQNLCIQMNIPYNNQMKDIVQKIINIIK